MRRRSISCWKTVAAAIALFLGVCSTTALAQNESGARQINRDAFRGLGAWYDTSNALYQLRYPILRSVPPLSSGMPYNILQSYIHIDSLMRFGTLLSSQNQFGARETGSIPPELKEWGARLYELADYDPVAFAQYQVEVGLLRGERYRSSLRGLSTNIEETLKANALRIQDGRALFSLLHADQVLRVRVVAIDSQPYKPLLMDGPHVRYRYRATAEVLDTLKGKVFAPCMQQAANTVKTESRNIAGHSLPCIQFQYDRNNYQHPSDYHSEGATIYKERDPAFMTADGYFQMKEGQEAIVFLYQRWVMVDSAADYFNTNLAMQASYNALPIINGQVRDVNRVWSQQEILPYQEWKSRLYAVREKILTGTY